MILRKFSFTFVFCFWAIQGFTASLAFAHMPKSPFVDLAKRVVPSVVNISVESQQVSREIDHPFQKDFRNFFGLPSFPSSPKRIPMHALGTGVIIQVDAQEALILTNQHVVSHADHVQVQLSEKYNGTRIDGKIIAKDKGLDIALIKISSEQTLQPLPFGKSSELEVGDYVMAVGNPLGQGHSVSHGIISAKGRSAPSLIGNYLQTDAPINPGNSGGPLVNLKGEIVGINNAILAPAQGIGYAIPSDSIETVLPELKKTGSVTRGYLGIRLASLSQKTAALSGHAEGLPYVALLEPNSPAEKGGIRKNDIIISVNEKPVRNAHDLLINVSSLPIGKKAKITVVRLGKEKTLNVKIGTRPST